MTTSKEYGFVVVFKNKTSNKKRDKLMTQVLKDKSVKCVYGKVNLIIQERKKPHRRRVRI